MARRGEYLDAVYRVTAKAVVRDGDRVLAVWDDDGFWNLPGGGIDHGESVIGALARELKEELGYEGEFTATYRDALTYYSARLGYCCMHLIFDVTLAEYEGTVGDDAARAAFINPQEFADSDRIAHQFIYKYGADEEFAIAFEQ